jgi:hypothetical protein
MNIMIKNGIRKKTYFNIFLTLKKKGKLGAVDMVIWRKNMESHFKSSGDMLIIFIKRDV